MRQWIDIMEGAETTPARALILKVSEELLPDVELHLVPKSPTVVHLDSIKVIERGLGSGSRTMRMLCGHADDLGVTIILQPYSDIGGDHGFFGFGPEEYSEDWNDELNVEQLRVWYTKFGFRMLGPEDASDNPAHDVDEEGLVMIRKPQQSLSEAPIADFSVHGDTENAGSFRSDDVKAMNSPKWQLKLKTLFKSVEADVNVCLFNMPDEKMRQERPKLLSFGRPHDVKIDLSNSKLWSGLYSPEDYLAHFGMLPPEYQDRINITLLANEGDGRIPLTQWMVAHRFMHSLSNEEVSKSRNMQFLVVPFREFYKTMIEAVEFIWEAKNNKWAIFGKPALPYNELYHQLATFGSARNNKLLHVGEFVIDIATQAFLKGDFDFRYETLDLDAKTIEKVEEHLEIARQALKKIFGLAKGKLTVF